MEKKKDSDFTIVSVKMTWEEHDAIEREAKNDRRNISDECRHLLELGIMLNHRIEQKKKDFINESMIDEGESSLPTASGEK